MHSWVERKTHVDCRYCISTGDKREGLSLPHFLHTAEDAVSPTSLGKFTSRNFLHIDGEHSKSYTTKARLNEIVCCTVGSLGKQQISSSLACCLLMPAVSLYGCTLPLACACENVFAREYSLSSMPGRGCDSSECAEELACLCMYARKHMLICAWCVRVCAYHKSVLHEVHLEGLLLSLNRQTSICAFKLRLRPYIDQNLESDRLHTKLISILNQV